MAEPRYFVDGRNECIAQVWSTFADYTAALTLTSQAKNLIELSNAISDLSTYHPEFNDRTGMIDGVYEEE